MSVLEQYTYDGSRKPDFQALPTLVVPDEAMPADGTEASGNEGDDREIQIREQLKAKAKARSYCHPSGNAVFGENGDESVSEEGNEGRSEDLQLQERGVLSRLPVADA